MKALGGDNNLLVTLSIYKPKITCGRRDSFRNAPSCGGLLENMPASTEKLLFGPDNVPGIQEPLPQLVASSESGYDTLLLLEPHLMDV